MVEVCNVTSNLVARLQERDAELLWASLLPPVRVDPAHLEGLAERQAPFHDGGVERIKPRDRYVGWKRASIVGDGHSLPALHVICRGPTPEGTARSLSAHCKPC